MKRLYWLVPLVTALVVVAACSSSGNTGGSDDSSMIRGRVSSVVSHFNSGDSKAILDSDVPASARRTCSDKDAKDAVSSAQQQLKALGGKLSVKSVDNIVVSGNKATADVTVNTGIAAVPSQIVPAMFVKNGGSWRVDTSALQGCNGLFFSGLG
ncbi:MAG: Rv0361 family membrane protein [Dehalococcoidia bacterium]